MRSHTRIHTDEAGTRFIVTEHPSSDGTAPGRWSMRPETPLGDVRSSHAVLEAGMGDRGERIYIDLKPCNRMLFAGTVQHALERAAKALKDPPVRTGVMRVSMHSWIVDGE